tara:strand:- start:7678 stop:8424 length:747 start_codon:yes stop_codon:yes gene_type:complete
VFIWWNLIGFRNYINIEAVEKITQQKGYDLFEQVMKEGQKIDLTGCYYGEGHGLDKGKFHNKPFPYYYFLAGLVRSQKLSNILELGTHFGGATMSMSRGINKENIKKSRVVTVDITNKNIEEFKKYPNIKRIQGSDLDEQVVKRVIEFFDRPIDLLYIDSNHTYDHVMETFALYVTKLNPKYIVLDDIHLNLHMELLWRNLKVKLKDRAFDVTEISRRGNLLDVGRRKFAGMGVILWDESYNEQFLAK